jgi:hypothetical protein
LMTRTTENPCPNCGCKGRKTPHIRIHTRAEAEEFCWRDLICGSCGLPFRSYPFPLSAKKKDPVEGRTE